MASEIVIIDGENNKKFEEFEGSENAQISKDSFAEREKVLSINIYQRQFEHTLIDFLIGENKGLSSVAIVKNIANLLYNASCVRAITAYSDEYPHQEGGYDEPSPTEIAKYYVEIFGEFLDKLKLDYVNESRKKSAHIILKDLLNQFKNNPLINENLLLDKLEETLRKRKNKEDDKQIKLFKLFSKNHRKSDNDSEKKSDNNENNERKNFYGN